MKPCIGAFESIFSILMVSNMNSKGKKRSNLFFWVRNRLFTGLVIALPLIATAGALSWVVQSIDNNVLGLIPERYKPHTYIGFEIPGAGLLIALFGLFVLGLVAQNFIGNAIISAGERLLSRIPIVSPVYGTLKQIVTTIAEQRERAFREVCLVEYPRPGLWAIGFVTSDLNGAPAEILTKDYVCIFVPTTPNPTSGFLLFVKRVDIKILDMTPEEGAKMIVSGGMVSSNDAVTTVAKAEKQARSAKK